MYNNAQALRFRGTLEEQGCWLQMVQKDNRSYQVIINAQSGGGAAVSRSVVKAALKQSALEVKCFKWLDPDDFIKALCELKQADGPVLIGGGDGSVSFAGRLCMEKKIPFGILPFGTMNMLARDLDIPLKVEEMFKAYEQARSISIDVGLLNGQPFLCAAALGVMPEASRLREETRTQSDLLNVPRVGAFVFSELNKTKRRRLKIAIDNKTRNVKTNMVVVSNNQYTMSEIWGNNKFYRPSLKSGKLGLYMVAPDRFWDKVRLLLRLHFGAWMRDPALREYTGQAVVITTEHDTELVSLDGEPLEMKTPLNFTIVPKALKIIVPKAYGNV